MDRRWSDLLHLRDRQLRRKLYEPGSSVTTRTSKKTVTFNNPFVIGNLKEIQAAGEYLIETDEELIEGLSFNAYRRVLTLFHLHERPNQPGIKSTLTIAPAELETALARDQEITSKNEQSLKKR